MKSLVSGCTETAARLLPLSPPTAHPTTWKRRLFPRAALLCGPPCQIPSDSSCHLLHHSQLCPPPSPPRPCSHSGPAPPAPLQPPLSSSVLLVSPGEHASPLLGGRKLLCRDSRSLQLFHPPMAGRGVLPQGYHIAPVSTLTALTNRGGTVCTHLLGFYPWPCPSWKPGFLHG